MTVKRPTGCRNFHIALHTKGSDGTIGFATPERLHGLESLSSTNGYAEAQAYSDNLMDTNIRKPAYVDLAVVLRELALKHEAMIMGKKYVGGKLVTSADDVAPSCAVLYEQTNSDGTSTLKCYYNCTLSKDGNENTTVADSITFDTVSLTGKAIPLSNGVLDLSIETDDPDVSAEDIANFFKKVILPTTSGETPEALGILAHDEVVAGKTIDVITLEKKNPKKTV